jgi:hypothetical protein
VRSIIVLTVVLALSASAWAGGVALVDAAGAAHGTVKVTLARGSVALKITGLARLPAPVNAFTATEYKAYLLSSTDAAREVFLTDLYPDARQRTTRKVVLGGDVSQMGFDRVVVTAFSEDGQNSFDVLTATLTP